jgi:hypothetical protein
VQAAINGFEITFMAPSRAFSTVHDDHGKSVVKLLMDLSNVHQRFKSVTHLVEYPQQQGCVPSVEYAMKVCSLCPVVSPVGLPNQMHVHGSSKHVPETCPWAEDVLCSAANATVGLMQ